MTKPKKYSNNVLVLLLTTVLIRETEHPAQTIKETINNKLSRNTKKERFKDQNLTLLNNSTEDLAVAAEFMYSKTILVQEVESKTRKSGNALASILKVPSSSPVMSIPDFFSKKWFNNPIGENSSNSGRKGD